MKKLIISLLIVTLMCCSGCTNKPLATVAEQGDIPYNNLNDCIMADEETHILYYYAPGENCILCPYYSKNGNLCKYEDGKIIEVIKDE